MAKVFLEECRDLTEPGERAIQVEIHSDGTMTVLCPCCDGGGEHDTHSGNDPDNCAYPCLPDLRRRRHPGARLPGESGLPELRTGVKPAREVRWKIRVRRADGRVSTSKAGYRRIDHVLIHMGLLANALQHRKSLQLRKIFRLQNASMRPAPEPAGVQSLCEKDLGRDRPEGQQGFQECLPAWSTPAFRLEPSPERHPGNLRTGQEAPQG